MTPTDRTRLVALAVEIETLASAVRLSTQHTTFTSPNPATLKKYLRTDGDVARWLDRLASSHARLVALRTELGLVAPMTDDQPEACS